MKLPDSSVAPSCGFCCWNDDIGDITCKECRFISGPKAPRDVGRFPARPKTGISWLVDSGSEIPRQKQPLTKKGKTEKEKVSGMRTASMSVTTLWLRLVVLST